MFFLVLRHPACASCVAWMCCRMSNSDNQACMRMSQSIIAAWASINIAIMLLLVLRHPTCVSCVAWMCCTMSDSIKHVRTCPDLSLDRLWLYTFLHSLHSNFAPSRPLQLWFEAPCEASLARDKYAMQSTPKIRRGRYSFICLSVRSYWMISVRDKKHGTCLRNGRGCAAWALVFYCKHVVNGATSSNLRIMCCMDVL